MPLQAFTFPFPETRFFKAGGFIYKFKIRGGCSFRGEEVRGGNGLNQELEEIIRAVLGNLDSLQPFYSAHFIVFPYKKLWEGASKVKCKHGERKMRAYPFSLILYLEKNMQSEKQAEQKLSTGREVAQQFPSVSEPRSKRHKRDSPLEEAILKDLSLDLEAESNVSVVGLSVHCPHAEREVKEDPGHVDKRGSRGFDEPQQRSGVNTVRGTGTPGEVHAGTINHMREEEEEYADSVPGTPVRPGILTRLARLVRRHLQPILLACYKLKLEDEPNSRAVNQRHIFPFSLFFREP